MYKTKWLDELKVVYSIQSGQICKSISAGFIRKSLDYYLQTSSVMDDLEYFLLPVSQISMHIILMNALENSKSLKIRPPEI